MNPSNMNTPPQNPWWWNELWAILGVAGAVTFGLWIRRAVSGLIGAKMVDEKILAGDLKQPTPPNGTNGTTQPTLYRPDRPFQPQPKAVFREGGGYTYVPGFPAKLYYRAKYNTADGVEVYDHDEQLRRDHTEGPCPILNMREACYQCKWYVREVSYKWSSQCAAKIWLDECKDENLPIEQVLRGM